MSYSFDFTDVWNARADLLWGALATLRLSVLSMVISLALAVVGAFLAVSAHRIVRWLITFYVEAVRNTPFLVQIFLLFFGLPTIGVRFDANQAALLAMSLNGTAYTIEIVRAGIESVDRGQIEAGRALGLRNAAIFRFLILPQALRVTIAPLGSQFILLMLGSSVVSAISANELMSAAQHIASETYRSFEVYAVVAAIYLALSFALSFAFAGLGRLAFGRQGQG